jgi:hypothetical protein
VFFGEIIAEIEMRTVSFFGGAASCAAPGVKHPIIMPTITGAARNMRPFGIIFIFLFLTLASPLARGSLRIPP